MLGRESNFFHVVKLLRIPREAIILPLLGKGERREGLKVKDRDERGPVWLEEALRSRGLPPETPCPAHAAHEVRAPSVRRAGAAVPKWGISRVRHVRPTELVSGRTEIQTQLFRIPKSVCAPLPLVGRKTKEEGKKEGKEGPGLWRAER